MRNMRDAKGFDNARPAGWYPVVFEGLESCTSAAGNEQIKVTAAIREGDFMNGKFWDYLPLDPEKAGSIRTTKFAVAFGKDPEFDDEELCSELLGTEAWVKVSRKMGKDQEGEPKMENRIQVYSAEDPGEATPTKEDLARIEAKEGGKFVEEPASKTTKKNGATPLGASKKPALKTQSRRA